MGTFRDRVEANFTAWFLGTLLAGFAAGFAAFGTIQRVGGLVTLTSVAVEQQKAAVNALQAGNDSLEKLLLEARNTPGHEGQSPDASLTTLTAALSTCQADLAASRVPPPGKWRHIIMPPGTTGPQVADRLTQIGPPARTVVVAYDGSTNTFHLWYVGGGSGTTYEYGYLPPADLKEAQPQLNYFINDGAIVPSGIGGAGTEAVPIFFKATAH